MLSKIPKHIWWGVVLPLVLVGLGVWRLWPTVEEYRAEDERAARIWLDALANLETKYRGRDADGNGVRDFWTADVVGLLKGVAPNASFPIHGADAAPLRLLTPSPTPFRGYLFVALKRDMSSVPPENYLQDTDKSDRKVHHLSRFAFCAYPAQYDWRHRKTFIVNQDNVVYAVDNGGKPITEWPSETELAERFIAEGFPILYTY